MRFGARVLPTQPGKNVKMRFSLSPPPRRGGGARGDVVVMRRGLHVLRLELLGHLLVARVSILAHRIPSVVCRRDAVEVYLPQGLRGLLRRGRAVGLPVSSAPVGRLALPVRAVRHVPPIVAVRLLEELLLDGRELGLLGFKPRTRRAAAAKDSGNLGTPLDGAVVGELAAPDPVIRVQHRARAVVDEQPFHEHVRFRVRHRSLARAVRLQILRRVFIRARGSHLVDDPPGLVLDREPPLIVGHPRRQLENPVLAAVFVPHGRHANLGLALRHDVRVPDLVVVVDSGVHHGRLGGSLHARGVQGELGGVVLVVHDGEGDEEDDADDHRGEDRDGDVDPDASLLPRGELVVLLALGDPWDRVALLRVDVAAAAGGPETRAAPLAEQPLGLLLRHGA
mmetsp:Transcript_9297/g.37642  ORF Transcript_9297/g.37642 Transcript_9297/m.37642 type:complete len:395 (-) Transcript_9297:253-1437(-)